uniref:Uncharacterized protein n=1 Tax=Oryza nivara TaxID=4536 RepID=A0A0E0H8C6_ORYNI
MYSAASANGAAISHPSIYGSGGVDEIERVGNTWQDLTKKGREDKGPHKPISNLLSPHSPLLPSQPKPPGHSPMGREKVSVGGEKLDGGGRRLT